MQPNTMSGWARNALAHATLSQAALARELTNALGRSIDRAAVNKMLAGTRKIAVDEMTTISEITGFPLPLSNSVIAHVSLLSWVSAGDLVDAESQIPVEDVPLLAFADLGHGEFFALKVVGDSMNLISPEGSIIVVNRADRALVPDKPYVFWHRAEGATYKLWQSSPDHLAPCSTNRAHKPRFVKGKSEFSVIGRVRRTVLDL